MNSTIEMFNLWGDRFLTFAWPMLWQSSLLIVVLFAGDFALRRRIRPAVRYTLWLVLLLKLLMPPSLALPTSIAWWLRANPQSPQKPAEPLKTFVVTYGDTVQSEPLPVAQHVERPRPKPSTAAWLLAGGALGSVGLLGVLLIRWRQITVEIRQTESAPDWTEELFDDVRKELNWRQSVRLRLTKRAMSPAVCGFFRPTILLPRALIERLEPNQLRAVLLHELIHLRRGDVWVNCAQALLQIVYWWHPLLWLANARIRRVREEAVDDAVMLALRENAENYAPTLLEVAKLAFSRPLASLGLVGILESRNALRQRIERLVNFRAPRHAGLTVASTFGIIAFAAIAAPMNKAPETSGDVLTPPRINDSLWPDPDYPGYKNLNIEAAYFLIEESKLRELFPAFNSEKPGSLQIGQDIGEFRHRLEQVGGRVISPSPTFQQFSGGRFHWRINENTNSYENQITYQTQRIGDRNILVGCDAVLHLPDWSSQEFTLTPWAEGDAIRCEISTTGWGEAVNLRMLLRTNETGFWAVPNVSPGICQVVVLHRSVPMPSAGPNANEEPGTPNKPETPASSDSLIRTNVLSASEGRGAIVNKLVNTKIRSISFDGVTLREALNALSNESKTRDPGGEGVKFTFMAGSAPMIDPNTGLPVDVSLLPITIKPAITDARLVDVLDAIVQVAPTPIRYSVESNTVAFFASSGNPPEPLYTRTFKVDTNAFYRALTESAGLQEPVNSTNMWQAIRTLFSSIDVDLHPPKNIFYSDSRGTLLVRASLNDLDAIAKFLLGLPELSPQISLQTRVIQIPEAVAKSLMKVGASTNTAFTFTALLTAPQFKEILKKFEQQTNTDILTMPEVTTLSGRQAQVQLVNTLTITKGIKPEALTPPGVTSSNDNVSAAFQIEQLPGPTVDLIPYVSVDGYRIQLTVSTKLNEFLGYDKPTNSAIVYVNGKQQSVVPPLPRHRVIETTASCILWDGQTVMLGGSSHDVLTTAREKAPMLADIPGSRDLTGSENTMTTTNRMFVFVTATLVDPAGKPVHTEEEILLARESVPPQTK